MADHEVASAHVSPCLLSDTHYARHCELVFSELSKNSKSYIKDFLTAIHDAITDTASSPTQTFLALKLLVNATETKNRDLMSRLATSSNLLNRLFHDAQYDFDETLDSKGKNYFSESPTKEVMKLGKDYIRLALEAFMYWNKEYGSVNSHDPLHCFYAVFTSLCGKTQLPTSYKFVNKNPQVKAYIQKVPRGSINRSPSPSASPERSPRASAFSRDDSPGPSPKLKGNEAYSQLLRCIDSQEDYERNSSAIFDLVEKPSLDYNKKLLDAVTGVLSSRSDHSYTNKFFALYLIVQITETKDKVFVTQLVRESPFLNKLYSQAKKKGIEFNGHDSNARRNLLDLTLEAIKFWHQEFGNPDASNPFYSFTYLYQTLQRRVSFPNEYYYIGRSLEKPFHEDRKIITKTEEVSDNKNDPIMRLVKVYISSGISFRDDSPNIASILIKQTKEKSFSYLQGTLRILNSTETTPNAKFYALYLLLRVAETKNNNFIAALAESKTLLNQLAADAMFDKNKPVGKRGAKFFSNQPSQDEAVIGSNYVQLLHETIRFLARNYGSENPRSVNNVFKTMLEKVQKEAPMETHDYYVGKNLKNIDDKSMKKFEVTPFHGSSVEISSPKARTKERVPFSIPELDKQLDQLDYFKKVLLVFLQDSSRENQDNTELADMLIQDVINQYNNNVHPHLQHLMNSSQTGFENYKDTIYHEGKIANELEQQLLDYKTGRTSFFQLKQNLIPLLASHSSPATSATSILLESRPVYEGRPSLYMGRLQNSSPGPDMRSRFSRSPGKVQSELLRPTPLAVSEGALLEFGRRDDRDDLERSSRKAATAVLPGRESFLGLRPFARESIVVPPVDNRPSSLQVIQPLEQFNQALEEKFKALDLLASRNALNRPERSTEFGGLHDNGFRSDKRAGTAHIPGREGLLNIKPLDRQYTFEPISAAPIDNRASSLKTIEPLEHFNRTLDEKFKALDMLASRSAVNRPSGQASYQPSQRNSLLSPTRDPLERRPYIQPSPLNMASTPKATNSFGIERPAFLSNPLYGPQTSSLGASGVGAGREPLGGFYMGKLGENTDNRGERNYFSNSVIGNRIGM